VPPSPLLNSPSERFAVVNGPVTSRPSHPLASGGCSPAAYFDARLVGLSFYLTTCLLIPGLLANAFFFLPERVLQSVFFCFLRSHVLVVVGREATCLPSCIVSPPTMTPLADRRDYNPIPFAIIAISPLVLRACSVPFPKGPFFGANPYPSP